MALVVMLTFTLASQVKAQWNDTVDLFESARDQLHFTISVKSELDRPYAVYDLDLCQTGVCNVFELRGPRNGEKIDVLLDFALVFMIYTLPYPNFAGPLSQDPETGERIGPPIQFVIDIREKGPALLEKYGEDCRVGSEAERALCVMRDMAARNDMRFYSARLTSGIRYVYPDPQILRRLNDLTPRHIESYIRMAERGDPTEQ